jgi:putative transposase
MSTYTQVYYHIVFSTKKREPALDAQWRREMLAYIWGVIKNHNCHLYRMGAMEDHIHIFSNLHPSVALSDLIKDIKISSHDWIETKGYQRNFCGWQEGYSAFTHSFAEKNNQIEYVKNQEEHHKRVSYRDELIALFREAGIEYNEKYLD